MHMVFHSGNSWLAQANRSVMIRMVIFFFQAEDGIRDYKVTGVQTCALPISIGEPKDAIRLGLGLVPEDRKRQGLVLGESGLHNTSLPILDRLSRAGFVRRGEEEQLTQSFFSKLRVRTPGLGAPVAGLSGGNQQKIVLARWLAAQSRILLLDEPTRGVDVGAKSEIHGLIRDLAARGNAVLLISSELPEVIT